MGGVTVIEEFRKKKSEAGLKQIRKPAEIHKLPAPKRPRIIKETWFCVCGEENKDDMEKCWKCDKERPWG